MRMLTFTEFESDYGEVLDSVVSDSQAVAITREGQEPVVVLALDQSLRETVYLMRSSANARRLADSMERLEGRAQLS
jgi:antitoxin YefM